MVSSTVWWLLAGGLVIIELLTGSFYLLMLAIGAVAGAIAVHLGAPLNLQRAIAIVGGLLAVAACYTVRKRLPKNAPARKNKDVNMDVGELVDVGQWNHDGTAQVRYRGAQWTAVARHADISLPGRYRIAEVIGSRLVLDKA